MEPQSLDASGLYRLPWNMADNAITWLEPTTVCNLECRGCYKSGSARGHRPLGEIKQELRHILKLRKCDSISIAGGEPLLYPHIVELVRHITSLGVKAVINTNGVELSPGLIGELAAAGLTSFTVHVDSRQGRPGWEGKSEPELNQLRGSYARMIRRAGRGRVSCSFNATIFPETLGDVPGLSRWAWENIDLVQTMVFILYRAAKAPDGVRYQAAGKPVGPEVIGLLGFEPDLEDKIQHLTAAETARLLGRSQGGFRPAAFLNSTEDPGSVKWLLALRAGRPGGARAWLGPKFAEFVQVFHHLIWGTYLAYSRPRHMGLAQALFPLALMDSGVRRLLWGWLKRPKQMLKPLRMQALMIIQPVDFLPDGRLGMCDGCPDAIYHQGKFMWSCRLTEVERLGGFIQGHPEAKGPKA